MIVQLKNTIKDKLCVMDIAPNYPLRNLVESLDNLKPSTSLLIHSLDEIQVELDTETALLSAAIHSQNPQIVMRKRYRCLYYA